MKCIDLVPALELHSHGIRPYAPSVCGIFHSVYRWHWATFLYVSAVHSFSLLSSVPSYGCPTVCLPIQLLMDSQTVSSSWLSWKKQVVFQWVFLHLHPHSLLFVVCPQHSRESESFKILILKYQILLLLCLKFSRTSSSHSDKQT